jgi:hypothetical protein
MSITKSESLKTLLVVISIVFLSYYSKSQEFDIESIPLEYNKVKSATLIEFNWDRQKKEMKSDTIKMYCFDTLYRIIKAVTYHYHFKTVDEYFYDDSGNKILRPKQKKNDTDKVVFYGWACGGMFIPKKHIIVRDKHARIIKEKFVSYDRNFLGVFLHRGFLGPFKMRWSHIYYYNSKTGLLTKIDMGRRRNFIKINYTF